MAGDTVPWCYLDDSGRAYRTRVARYLAEQVDADGSPLIGGRPLGDEVLGPLPAGLKPRYVYVHDQETGKSRRLTVFSSRAPLSRIGAMVQLRQGDGSLRTYVRGHGGRGEGRRARTDSPQRVSWCYTADSGETYERVVARYLVEQVDSDGRSLQGGRPMTNDDAFPPLPRSLRFRTVTVVNLDTLKSQRLVVYSREAPLWTGVAKTINLRRVPSATGELRPHQVRSKTEEVGGRPNRNAQADRAAVTVGVGEVFDSTLEAAFFDAWGRSTKLRLVPQYSILGYHLDFAHLTSKTAIEIDGYFYHRDQDRFRKDRQRDRELAERGWQVMRFAGEEVVENLEGCVAQALRLIQTRSRIADD